MLLSVIVPIYNSAEYLVKCVNSIINQTYTNLEIVLIDDGSTDASSLICDNFAKQDKRIVVIHKKNEGLVKARKDGIGYCHGEFTGYVDSDDYIEKDYFEKLVDTQKKSGVDIVAAGHYHDIGENSSIVRNGIQPGVYDIKEICSRLIYTGIFFEYGITPQVYTKIFRTCILKQVQLAVPENIVAGEDAAVTYPFLLNAAKITTIDYAGYHYIQRAGTMTKTSYGNESERVNSLICYLRETAENMKAGNIFTDQLSIYRKYLLALRDIEELDSGEKRILSPYGGLDSGNRVVIYGAGVLGQKVYSYLQKFRQIQVMAWVDRNWKVYQQQGLTVAAPEEILENNIEFDKILIANITEKTAVSIRDFLLNKGIPEEKIYWFTKEFRR